MRLADAGVDLRRGSPNWIQGTFESARAAEGNLAAYGWDISCCKILRAVIDWGSASSS